MKTVQKIINHVINESILPLKFSSLLETRWMTFGDIRFMSKHTLHKIHPSTYMFQLDLLPLLIKYS